MTRSVLVVLTVLCISYCVADHESLILRHLVKRQQAGIGGAAGGGMGGSSGNAHGSNPEGLATAAVLSGSLGGGGGATLQIETLLGGVTGAFGAGLGGGIGSALSTGAETSSGVITSGSGSGLGAEIAGGGPIG